MIFSPRRYGRMSMKRIMSKKRAFTIIDNFSRSGVLVVGDIMADHFIWGRVSRISPEAPVPVVEVTKDNFMLGGCANVLNNIFAMGGRVYLAGVVGSDETGSEADLRVPQPGCGYGRHRRGGGAPHDAQDADRGAWSAGGPVRPGGSQAGAGEKHPEDPFLYPSRYGMIWAPS